MSSSAQPQLVHIKATDGLAWQFSYMTLFPGGGLRGAR